MTNAHIPRLVLPVVHHLDVDTTMSQAKIAFQAGAAGVFLISHNGRDAQIAHCARLLKEQYPERKIGLNLLGAPASIALTIASNIGIDMVWADAPGVTSAGWTPAGLVLSERLKLAGLPTFFGSVAFKYQPHDPCPARAAQTCAQGGMLPTTSGEGTGKAPQLEKAQLMSEALAGGPLAVASGMTPENIAQYLPYFTHYLVATGVSRDMHHFDEARLAAFVQAVQAYAPPTTSPN